MTTTTSAPDRAPVEPPARTKAPGPARPGGPVPNWPLMLIGSLAVAGLSLVLLPRTIAYDPWSWLIWGREILHLDLNTRGAATAVKPLPIFINTVYALAGSRAEPVLWLLTARGATVLALVLAYRLGARLGGVGAGILAAIGLAVSDQFLGYLFMQGMSEPMATAAMLAAVDSYVGGKPRATYWWLVATGLLRPEAWPFLIVYAVVAAYPGLTPQTLRARWRHPSLTPRKVAGIVLALVVPPSWFVIDWFGARQFFRSANAATQQSQGGPLLSREPGLATFKETWHLMSAPVVVLFLLGFAVALIRSARRRKMTAAAWLGVAAFAWLVIDAVLAQGRFATGAPRYLLPGSALACVVAGLFLTDAIRVLHARLPVPRLAVAGTVAGCLVVVACFVSPAITAGRQVRNGARQGRVAVHLRSALTAAIRVDGGRRAVLSCGPVITKNFQVPLVAWSLKVPVGTVGYIPLGEGTVFQQLLAPRVAVPLKQNYSYVGTAGPADAQWTVLRSC